MKWYRALQVYVTHIEINCKFSNNISRGSKMNRNGYLFNVFMSWRLDRLKEYCEPLACMEGYHSNPF